ncbi:MAG: 4'-phosphopantetheinyl transferase superfamily protein [Planctomycetota bacterium]|nr:4'-phosphopantetheinyl transferase superfamily protein [Planctomycetota bacterium]
MNVLHVVIRPTPGQGFREPARKRVDAQKRAAREALSLAAERQGLSVGTMPRNEHGAPQPVDGHFWSITHTSEYAGGAAAPWPLGIDIEGVREPSPEVIAEAASEAELEVVMRIFGESEAEAFSRLWSAKEALLKLTGEGLCGLSKVSLSPSSDLEHRPGLWLHHGQGEHFVHQLRHGAHFASVTCGPISHVHWDWQHAAEGAPDVAKAAKAAKR